MFCGPPWVSSRPQYIYKATLVAHKCIFCLQIRLRQTPCSSSRPQNRRSLVLHPSLPRVASTVQFAVSASISSSIPTTSAEPISLPTPERLRCLVFALCAHVLLCVAHRCWVGTTLLAWARSVLDARGREVGSTSGACCLTTALVHRCALFTVGVDAAFGEVVGATTREDEDSPAIGY